MPLCLSLKILGKSEIWGNPYSIFFFENGGALTDSLKTRGKLASTGEPTLNFFLGTSLFVCLSEGMTIDRGGGENRLKTARDGVGYFWRAPLLRNHLY